MPVNHPKVWLIYEARSGTWWGPNRQGYFRNVTEAGLYTEEEAKRIASNPDPGRRDEAISLEEYREGIERLYHTLNPHEFLPSEVRK